MPLIRRPHAHNTQQLRFCVRWKSLRMGFRAERKVSFRALRLPFLIVIVHVRMWVRKNWLYTIYEHNIYIPLTVRELYDALRRSDSTHTRSWWSDGEQSIGLLLIHELDRLAANENAIGSFRKYFFFRERYKQQSIWRFELNVLYQLDFG